MVYTVFYKTSSFAGYCFLNKNSIHPKRRDVFNFKHFEVTLVKFQICSFIVFTYIYSRTSLTVDTFIRRCIYSSFSKISRVIRYSEAFGI